MSQCRKDVGSVDVLRFHAFPHRIQHSCFAFLLYDDWCLGMVITFDSRLRQML
jgi:hypothetical protein